MYRCGNHGGRGRMPAWDEPCQQTRLISIAATGDMKRRAARLMASYLADHDAGDSPDAVVGTLAATTT